MNFKFTHSAGFASGSLNERLPRKALNILQQVCQDIDYERTQLGRRRSEVLVDDVVQAVPKASGLPQETICDITD